MNLRISKNQHYSCELCGWCCRRFLVRIEEDEIERIRQLDWGDTPHPTDFVDTINGHTYFKRKPNGDCVFIDDTLGGCSIHRKFGYDVKALTCRGFPMNIVSIASGELSVLARMDCPAVLKNTGKPLREHKADIERLVSEMTFGDGFTVSQRQGLELPTVEFIATELRRVVRDTQLPIAQRVLWARYTLDMALKMGPSFLNDLDTLRDGVWLQMLRKNAQRAANPSATAISTWQRVCFRTWLTYYLRRDEERLTRSLVSRLKHFWHTMQFAFGFGNWRDFGKEHPNLPSRQSGLFSRPFTDNGADDAWQPYVDFLANRLDTLQFFGAAYYDAPFDTGLRALFMTYPLVLATAKAHAVERTPADEPLQITHEDVFRAVLAIDHAHGRSAALQSATARYYENFFAPPRLEALLHNI